MGETKYIFESNGKDDWEKYRKGKIRQSKSLKILVISVCECRGYYPEKGNSGKSSKGMISVREGMHA